MLLGPILNLGCFSFFNSAALFYVEENLCAVGKNSQFQEMSSGVHKTYFANIRPFSL